MLHEKAYSLLVEDDRVIIIKSERRVIGQGVVPARARHPVELF